MLQQTRVDAVIPYYERFLRRFPDVQALARASEDEVLRLWSGLGYYARARNLHAAARRIVRVHAGRFPRAPRALAELPGIGRSTAAAIAVFAFGGHAAILEGNVRRVLARCFGIEGFSGEPAVARELWSLAETLLPERSIRGYTQGLMDLGATVCLRTRPRCGICPFAAQCVATRAGRVDEIPAPRPRRTLPIRDARWLLLLHRGRVLLERRPSSGLWGGLWTFPELTTGGARSAGRALGCEIDSVRRLPLLEHGFTHYRLRVMPLLCSVRAVAPEVRQPGRLWLDVAAAAQGAVPVPVRKLLQQAAVTGRAAIISAPQGSGAGLRAAGGCHSSPAAAVSTPAARGGSRRAVRSPRSSTGTGTAARSAGQRPDR